MKALAMETSSTTATVALVVDGDVSERTIATPREQTARLLPLIDELLGARGLGLGALDAIVFGRGPGSFTGLRVAAAMAQGLSLAASVPLVGVSSLAALAQRAFEAARVERSLVCVDARMREVYSGVYAIRGGLAEAETPERLCAPGAVEPPPRARRSRAWSAVGDAFAAYPDELAALALRAERVLPALNPTAADLLRLAARDIAARRFLAPEQALPVYLRDESAWLP